MLENRNGNKASAHIFPALRPTLWDGITAALAVLLALCLLLKPAAPAGSFCVVSWDGGERTLSLREPETLTVESRGITLIALVLALVMVLYKKLRKKNLSVIGLILIAAAVGITVGYLLPLMGLAI